MDKYQKQILSQYAATRPQDKVYIFVEDGN